MVWKSFSLLCFYSLVIYVSTAERIRAEYKERASDLEARLAMALKNSDEEGRQQAEKQHNEEMEHLCEQHRLSMGEFPSPHTCCLTPLHRKTNTDLTTYEQERHK